MNKTFTRIGEFTISRLTEYKYKVGEVGLDVPVKLKEEDLESLEEFVKYYFGEDAFLIGMPMCAVVTFEIGSKTRRKEYGEKLLAEGREVEARPYLKDI